MRDRATLDRARGLLADAYERGAGTPQADKLVQQAVDLLSKSGPTMTGAGPIMSQAEVAVILDIDPTTVSKYRTRSKPGGPMASNPFPAPDNPGAPNPVWLVGRLGDLFTWQAERPGRGAGGGRPWHVDEQPKPELLVGLPTDWWTARDVLTYLEGIGQKITRDRLGRMLASGEMPAEEKSIGSERVWKPAVIRRWRPAPRAAAARR